MSLLISTRSISVPPTAQMVSQISSHVIIHYHRSGESGRNGASFVREVKRDTPADINGSIKVGDKITRVNGADVSSSNPATVVEAINKVKSDPLLLDVSRAATSTLSMGVNLPSHLVGKKL
jgi:C-terminal processing protease CtpA/Prc